MDPQLERTIDSIQGWLLVPQNPPVRYRTLVDLLGRPAGDPDVVAARDAISHFPPIAGLLAAQERDGYWVQPDYYIPKHYSTFWVLSVLADLGLTNENEHVSKGCEYLFAHQRENGSFCRRRRVAGRGILWEEYAEPCTHARIVRFLIQFGYGSDPHTRSAIEWLLATQREDAMWLCVWKCQQRGCLRATHDFLRLAALDAEVASLPATTRAAQVVLGLLLEPGMGRYHVGDSWQVLQYPYFGYGVISTLDALARLRYGLDHPKIERAVDFLLSRQLPGGGWALDQPVSHPPLDFGEPGEPNPWLTLDALIVLRLLDHVKPN